MHRILGEHMTAGCPLRGNRAVVAARTLAGFACGAGCLALPSGYPGYRWEVLAALGLIVALLVAAGRCVTRAQGALVAPALSLGALLGMAGITAAVAGGYLYGSLHVGAALDRRVPQCADAAVRRFLVTIVSLPEIRSDPVTGQPNARFEGLVRLEGPAEGCPGLGAHRVRLAWYGAPPLSVGETWRAEGKIRPPWGYRNPGGFDYERWLLGAGLDGTGYVRSGERLQIRPSAPLDALRTRLKVWIDGQGIRHGGLVLALMIGDDSMITSEQWDLLRDSGTIHLLVVSGLHVGLIAGCLLCLGRWLARLAPAPMLRFGAQRLGSTFALFGSGFYVLLAGAGIPAVRAWLMAAVVLVALASGRALARGRLLLIVLVLVLLHDPLAVHQQGFWLSFAAVAALIGFFSPRRSSGRPSSLRASGARAAVQFVQAQLVLLLGLSPLLALTQGAVPLVSPLANVVAVPVVTMAALPLLLVVGVLMFVLPSLAGVLLDVADAMLALVMGVVEEAAGVGPLAATVDGWFEAVLVACCVGWLALAPGPGRSLPVLLLWVASLWPITGVRGMTGEFRVLALDVGQGTSAIFETRRHTLIYDAGPAYPSGFDLGEAAVVPSHRRLYARPPDALVLSHDDADHTGGAQAVIRRLRPVRIWAAFADRLAPIQTRRCEQGQSWTWDGVRFEFLHPLGGSAPRTGSDNEQSCVLLVEGAHGRALIAGDVPAAVERRLELPTVDLLFAPHHGSRTSSSASLVRRADPGTVFVSAARRSRYGHPHPEVVERYRAAGASVHVTGWHGTLVWDSRRPGETRRWREDEGAYWHALIPGP